MSQIDIAYFNYEHGGLIGAGARGGGSGYDYTGLVRVMGEEGRWPDVFVMGEGDRYEFNGGEGMWGAVAAMRAAGGPAYLPLPGALPRQWGPFAPVTFVNTQTLVIERHYDHRAPDFAARNRNLTILSPATGGPPLHVVSIHGDLNDPALRLADARALRWLGRDDVLAVILGDWNETLSGPGHEPDDLDDPTHYSQPWKFHHKLRHQGGAPVTPSRQVCDALDYLCGAWGYGIGHRVGGIGFTDVAEQEQLTAGTRTRRPGDDRTPTQIDHILLNAQLSKRLVAGSGRIHEPLDPDRPDSDHKRLSVTVEL